jgi:hypothetical protein
MAGTERHGSHDAPRPRQQAPAAPGLARTMSGRFFGRNVRSATEGQQAPERSYLHQYELRCVRLTALDMTHG